VAALPYDVFSRHEAALEIEAHPRSFLRIDKTAALFSDEVDEYDERVYARAAELLRADMNSGVYLCEDESCYFLYRLTKGGHAQTGIVATIAVDDYETGVLKCHENTRAFKLEDRVRHITALEAQTGPVLVTYRPQKTIDEAVTRLVATDEPLYDFMAPDGVRHSVWRMGDSRLISAVRESFDALDALYIADGHHRAAAAVRVGAQRRKERGATGPTDHLATGPTDHLAAGPTDHLVTGPADHFLVVAFPADQLDILDYNRVVFDTFGFTNEELIARISENFDVKKRGTEPLKPQKRGEFSMYLNGAWYRLNIHEGLRLSDPVDALDVSLLHDYLLAPVLGINDPRSSKRIAYVGGVRGLEELERRADGGGVAFALFPCSLDELFAVADAGRLMPPKSTWFEPKPRSGLFIHRIGA
jgi:uncharacterized protein (DUF1015 family)